MAILLERGGRVGAGVGLKADAATLGSVSHIPIVGLALLIGVDRFMSKAGALTNLCGNAVAMVVIAMGEGV